MALKTPANTAPITAGITKAMATYSHWAEKGSPGGPALCEILVNQEKKPISPPIKSPYAITLPNYAANGRTAVTPADFYIIRDRPLVRRAPAARLHARASARGFYTL